MSDEGVNENPENEDDDDDEKTEDDDSEEDHSGKSIDDVAQEVLRGEWGQGQEQRLKLSQAGYDANEVRKAATRLRNNL